MKKLKNISVFILVFVLAGSVFGFVDERIKLNKKGEANLKAEIAPKETKVFVIAGKEFGVLSGKLKTKRGKVVWEIKAPNGKTILSGTKNGFKFKSSGNGDHKISIKNIGESRASLIARFDGVEGEDLRGKK